MAINSAAWLTEAKARPFQVKEAPIYTPEAGEILVKNHAVAINPVDGSLQAKAWWPMNYPTILGQDVAGEVVAVGPNVTRFKIGDRVVGHAVGIATKRLQDNAFQSHTILQINMASELPASVSYENAAVLPLALSTAACGLFQDDFLKLQLPTEPRRSTSQALLIWGGAGSVGSNAIQLGVAAGYEVFTTASPKNFEYVKKLGASQVFDYSSITVVEDLTKALQGKVLAGAMDTIGFAATPPTVDVVIKSEGSKLVSTVKGGFQAPEGVTVKSVFGTSLKDNHVGKAVWENFLPRALEAGTYIPAPSPLLAGKGLDKVQDAIDLQAKGASAKKVVVTL
ncbi:Zinc-binding alcohol dehydrogenase domain-containing protein cipB [Talaromyces atroroseus]|uniref:Zinc-binding alcohol dehydrogenase domain-containing protein cipB n=1 Tax=Talaromyces atroroseus TaxID=1441469 RepID=A0A225AL93_TALAT|nr:Zinc-binding alcohol dehydrogenase domain-containing protein cipB [Talaromyces atroroseus]OKL58018.1 Zinc-binding alcohol dehydrogenase domain-containing protein cipB [Talaromyces atroroseus]